MPKAGSSGISSSCALPPAGARASLSSTRNSTRRAGSTRPSSRACRRPPASPTSWPRRSIASPNRRRPERPTRSVFAISAHSGGSASPVEISTVVGGDERTEAACNGVTRMPFFRRLAPQQCLNKCGPPHLGFMSAQILHPMLRRVLIVAATVVPITLAGAGATARAEAGAAPFDGSLQRLAEILGALHYLRAICGANEGQKWRNEMQSLVDAEAPSGERRAHDRQLQSRLSRLPAELSHLHPGGRPGHSPLPRGRFQDRPRYDGALRQLTGAPASNAAPALLLPYGPKAETRARNPGREGVASLGCGLSINRSSSCA